MQIYNITNGEGLKTIVIKGERGSGTMALKGAVARKVQPDDHVIIASYALTDFEGAKNFMPPIVFPDKNFKI